MKLAGKVAIVTGSTRGIGKAIAMKLASEGAAIVVTARHIEQAHQVVDEIKNQGGTAIAFKTDVANRADVHNLIKGTLEYFKSIHIFVNNAGIGRPAPFLEVTEEDWDAVIDVDLKGVFNCTQEVLSHMIEQRYGKIINISSVGGVGFPRTDLASYGPAKAGVIMLTKITAMVAGPYGINVNCIAPGLIRGGTRMSAGYLGYTVGKLYDWAVAHFAERVAAVKGGQRLTYRELGEKANQLGNALLALGLKKGDRVGTLTTNSIESLVLDYGLAKAGLCQAILHEGIVINDVISFFAGISP